MSSGVFFFAPFMSDGVKVGFLFFISLDFSTFPSTKKTIHLIEKGTSILSHFQIDKINYEECMLWFKKFKY